jgi:hypothetical protein
VRGAISNGRPYRDTCRPNRTDSVLSARALWQQVRSPISPIAICNSHEGIAKLSEVVEIKQNDLIVVWKRASAS